MTKIEKVRDVFLRELFGNCTGSVAVRIDKKNKRNCIFVSVVKRDKRKAEKILDSLGKFDGVLVEIETLSAKEVQLKKEEDERFQSLKTRVRELADVLGWVYYQCSMKGLYQFEDKKYFIFNVGDEARLNFLEKLVEVLKEKYKNDKNEIQTWFYTRKLKLRGCSPIAILREDCWHPDDVKNHVKEIVASDVMELAKKDARRK